MLFTVCFMAILLRIVHINFSSYAEAGRSQSGYTLSVGTTRGKIYDRNRQLLVDTENELVAAVSPIASAKNYLSSIFQSDDIIADIEDCRPFISAVEEKIDNELIRTFEVPVRYSEADPASHIVGYVDSSGKGVTGIEKAFEDLLSGYGGRLSVTFEVDAVGRALAGMDKTVKDENFNSTGGVMLTLDKRIQQLTEEAIEQSNIESGCAVVMHVDSGDVVALASVPGFDRNNVEQSLAADNSPLVNKALVSYSSGSVFKSILTAFALEKGISEEFSYTCEGSITVGNKKIKCYNETAHGRLNLSLALQKSCNAYFIKLMEAVDSKEFLSFCRELGFGEGIVLCEGIESENGLLPDESSLYLEGNRANFAFGQGDLLVTPLHMVKAYHALATGTVVEPRLIYGFCDGEGKVTQQGGKATHRILSEDTVDKMREMLFDVTEEGIATNARSDLMKLAGKTGTAESGVYNENGEEIYRTWFVGFYPANNPHYIVAVLNEDGSGGNTDCAPVYKNICEWIACDSLRP